MDVNRMGMKIQDDLKMERFMIMTRMDGSTFLSLTDPSPLKSSATIFTTTTRTEHSLMLLFRPGLLILDTPRFVLLFSTTTSMAGKTFILHKTRVLEIRFLKTMATALSLR